MTFYKRWAHLQPIPMGTHSTDQKKTKVQQCIKLHNQRAQAIVLCGKVK